MPEPFFKQLSTDFPSVNSVTYGVSYGFEIALVYMAQTGVWVPKGANLGSER